MTAPSVRPLLSTLVAGLALGAVTLAGAPAAYAAPGDDGDIKVHRKGTQEPDQSNHPRVCEFHFAAFNFRDIPGSQIRWDIYNQPPTNSQSLRDGVIPLNSAGTGYSPDMSLPDGMYKVEVTWTGQMGAKKSKVFRVDCENGNGGPGGGNGHKPPHGPVGAGGGGSADLTGSTGDGAAFGIGSALAAGLAGTAGLILIRRSRRRADGAA
ncbi:hypothetical protein ABZ135_24620 [Streptomyces sp. NPDC006339]|uniref:hypothetical protein n=1 Tax=Streptomyces sp. NPDC006339 TaxID=3156755 RepID=UPI0033ADF6D3